jgi:hypothetical protein
MNHLCPASDLKLNLHADQDWQHTGVTVQVNDKVEKKMVGSGQC